MSGHVSKNLYDLLGNDVEDDTPAVNQERRIVEKKSTGTKHTGPTESSASRAPAGGNDGARKQQVGRESNLNRPLGDDAGASRGGRNARVRGGRGSGHARPNDDRHSRRTPGSEKQAAQSWGATEGQAELNDEEAAEQIAKNDQKEALAEGEGNAGAEGAETAAAWGDPSSGAAWGDPTDGASAEPAEPEVKQVSLDEFLAQRAEKKLGLGELQLRKANEGSKTDKAWADAKTLAKEETKEFISPSHTKNKRQRERKEKATIEIDNTFHETPSTRGGGRGGRGDRGDRSNFRGDRGDRNNFRGDRGDRDNFRGGDRGDRDNFRGGDRGDRGNFRGGPRGGRGGDRGGDRGGNRDGGRGFPQQRSKDAAINPADESAFPSLGA